MAYREKHSVDHIYLLKYTFHALIIEQNPYATHMHFIYQISKKKKAFEFHLRCIGNDLLSV